MSNAALVPGSHRRPFLALVVAVLIAMTALGTLAWPVGTAQASDEARVGSTWSPRPEQYPGVVVRRDIPITMSDGITLYADLKLPADATGAEVPGRFPVIVTITAYNKGALDSRLGAATGGAATDYLVRRGYAQLTVDARGTGSSEGVWEAFSPRENQDAGEIVAWAASLERPWSNGRVGMSGPSYMGISQLFAASHRPEGLKAIFPQVPAADVYRDVVASGGALDVGFIPLWLGLVTGSGVIPPAYGVADPRSAIEMYLYRLQTGGTFTAQTLVEATLGGERAYDGPFYFDRSPINVIDRVDVPTFLVAGQYDIFQRGTPMLFERLRQRGVPVKMVVGPWNHLQASSGEGLDDAAYGSLAELQLRWFDRYVKGLPDPTLDADIPPLTWHEINSGRWHRGTDWVKEQRAASFRLSGTAVAGGAHGALVRDGAEPGTSAVPPVPVSGLCTRSTGQWTAGLAESFPGYTQVCTDSRWNDRSGPVWETAPMTEPVRFRGPINARLYTSTPTGNGMLSVSVSTVAPDGTVNRLTGGWQVLSHRALDTARSRYLDGELIQPHHPFTKVAQRLMAPGAVEPVDVEVFPTGAVVPAGHRLRVSVQAYDVPHLLPTLGDLSAAATPLAIHSSERHPSRVTLPTIPARRP